MEVNAKNVNHFNQFYLEHLPSIKSLQQQITELQLTNMILKNSLDEKDQIEHYLRESENRFRLLAENSTDMISRHSPKGVYLYASPACRTLLGYQPHEMVGKSFFDFIHHYDASKMKKLFQKKNHINSFTYRARKKDGSHLWFETNLRIIHKKNSKKIIEWQAATRDVTQRIVAEKSQKQTKKLADVIRSISMEEVASGIAHEVNQPLAAVLNYTQGCVRHMQNDDCDKNKVLEIMKKAATQAERAGDIIHRLKNFFCKGKLYPEQENVNRLIRQAIAYIRPELSSSKVKVNLELQKPLPKISIDKIHFQQIVLNLAQNAIESMQEAKVKNKYITIRTVHDEKPEIKIEFFDNGLGFSRELIQKVTTPFFTTKKNGMGMGLTICHSVIEAHGGTLKIIPRSKQMNGCVRLTLPI
ncbi:MAG: PAS domain S-box protein [Gammaproteobacteria bacterium]